MKKLKNVSFWLVLVALGLLGCGEEGGLKGVLKISITDAPIDADNVKAVNLVITNVEGYQNGKWKSFRNFEQPIGVNLMAYTGGKSILLIDQFTNPGEYSSLRLSLNIANRNSSLIINPQSNLVFKNGTSAPLYMADDKTPEVIIEKSIGISSRGSTDLTIDFDLRKSIRQNEIGEYVIDPFVRTVKTNDTGQLRSTIVGSIPDRVVVYAYPKGKFTTNETLANSAGFLFFNASTSSSIKAKDFILGFLESGSYDLVFVKYREDGTFLEAMGKLMDINVAAGEQTNIEVNLEQLSPS